MGAPAVPSSVAQQLWIVHCGRRYFHGEKKKRVYLFLFGKRALSFFLKRNCNSVSDWRNCGTERKSNRCGFHGHAFWNSLLEAGCVFAVSSYVKHKWAVWMPDNFASFTDCLFVVKWSTPSCTFFPMRTNKCQAHTRTFTHTHPHTHICTHMHTYLFFNAHTCTGIAVVRGVIFALCLKRDNEGRVNSPVATLAAYVAGNNTWYVIDESLAISELSQLKSRSRLSLFGVSDWLIVLGDVLELEEQMKTEVTLWSGDSI